MIKANIGDAHAMGQTPVTFIRQVLACVSYPALLESSEFPEDVKEHSHELLKSVAGGSVGKNCDDLARFCYLYLRLV